jgi:hypothetical protein
MCLSRTRLRIPIWLYFGTSMDVRLGYRAMASTAGTLFYGLLTTLATTQPSTTHNQYSLNSLTIYNPYSQSN